MVEEKSKINAWEKALEPPEEERALEAKTKEEQDLLLRQKQQRSTGGQSWRIWVAQWAKREYLRMNLKGRIPVKGKGLHRGRVKAERRVPLRRGEWIKKRVCKYWRLDSVSLE